MTKEQLHNEGHVTPLQLSPEQMQAAVKRATANASTWAVWNDPKTTKENDNRTLAQPSPLKTIPTYTTYGIDQKPIV